MFSESLRVARQNGHLVMLAYAQLGLALLATRNGHAETAARLHGAADAIHESLGNHVEGVESRLRYADLARPRAELGAAAFEAEYRAGMEKTPGLVLA